MTVSMDMAALEQTMSQIMAATDLPEDDPYVVAAAMSCTDATYDQMMCGPAQMTEAQCCVAAWCRLFRCDDVDGRDVAFAMSAFSIGTINLALSAIDSCTSPCGPIETDDAYQVLKACVEIAPARTTVHEAAAGRMLIKCAELLKTDVVAKG